MVNDLEASKTESRRGSKRGAVEADVTARVSYALTRDEQFRQDLPCTKLSVDVDRYAEDGTTATAGEDVTKEDRSRSGSG